MHMSQIEEFSETLLGPMVGIGVNEETYAQPQDANIYISARYMPHKIYPEIAVSLQKN